VVGREEVLDSKSIPKVKGNILDHMLNNVIKRYLKCFKIEEFEVCIPDTYEKYIDLDLTGNRKNMRKFHRLFNRTAL